MFISDLQSLKNILQVWQNDSNVMGILLFACDQNRPSTEDLQSLLHLNSKPLMGGIFPEIIADGERKKEGFLIMPLESSWVVTSIENTNDETSMKEYLNTWTNESSVEIETVFCFVNALWPQKTALINTMYDALGPFVHYLGGGAGSLSFQSFPCVFANQKIVENGAVLGITQKTLSIGVAHGWHSISEPIKVTETNENTIVSLNWKPAFEVYQSWVEAHANQKINETNFFDIAKSYPLGFVRLDDEMIIRDPYATSDLKLHVVDEVPEGEYIRIMHGSTESLLEGAKNAVLESSWPNHDRTTQFCIDCISRVLFMEDDFIKELNFLNKNQEANGILSIGEIANPMNAPLELYNKTVVVAQWKKKN